MSLVPLVGAGLLVRSFRSLENQQFGFESQSRLIVRLNPALAGYTFDGLPGLYRQLQDRFSRMPGVLSASMALHSPMDGWNWSSQVWIQGRQPEENSHDDNAIYDFVSAHYFETIGTRLLRGRVIEESDTPTALRVAVVNDALVRKYFPNEDPIGKHLGFNARSHAGDYEIVGVVENEVSCAMSRWLLRRVPTCSARFVILMTVKLGSISARAVRISFCRLSGRPAMCN